uniref:Cornifelin n=1 Tax=Pelusios castaneus TaxID=367368 RepID=A0A8C8S396_9SAUR
MAFQSEVVMGVQPGPVGTSYSNSAPSSWNSDLCDCCADMGVCLCGTFVPCILAAQVSKDFGESCFLPCLPGTILALRTGVRERYHIQGSICGDWVAMVCCGPCALCQLSRELSYQK